MNTPGLTAPGMDFGPWSEPECVSPRSRLYAEHPSVTVESGGRVGLATVSRPRLSVTWQPDAAVVVLERS